MAAAIVTPATTAMRAIVDGTDPHLRGTGVGVRSVVRAGIAPVAAGMALRPVLVTGTRGGKCFSKVGQLSNCGCRYRRHHPFDRASNDFTPVELARKRL